jgi:autotransporter translocation and assembly factor TamB
MIKRRWRNRNRPSNDIHLIDSKLVRGIQGKLTDLYQDCPFGQWIIRNARNSLRATGEDSNSWDAHRQVQAPALNSLWFVC